MSKSLENAVGERGATAASAGKRRLSRMAAMGLAIAGLTWFPCRSLAAGTEPTPAERVKADGEQINPSGKTAKQARQDQDMADAKTLKDEANDDTTAPAAVSPTTPATPATPAMPASTANDAAETRDVGNAGDAATVPSKLPAKTIRQTAASKAAADKKDRAKEAGKAKSKTVKNANGGKGVAKAPHIGLTKDGKLPSGTEADDAAAQATPPGFVVNIGKNLKKNVPVVRRYDDDEAQLQPQEVNGRGKFFKGSKVELPGSKEESIRYVYVSRGAWLIRSFQPYLDRLGLEVMKADSADVYAGYMETSRTFSYLCLLIASDDGSSKMLHAIGKAVALHREAVSSLRLLWQKKNEAVNNLFEEYIKITFMKNTDSLTHIPAGSLSNSEYKSLKDTYQSDQDEDDATPLFSKKGLSKLKGP